MTSLPCHQISSRDIEDIQEDSHQRQSTDSNGQRENISVVATCDSGPQRSDIRQVQSSVFDSNGLHSDPELSSTFRNPSELRFDLPHRSTPSDTVGVVLDPKYRQYLLHCVLFLASLIWVAATICYAFLSSSQYPRAVFSKPENTVLVLNIASTVSVFLLGALVIAACDNLRWSLATAPPGVGFATFLGLSRATSLYGVLILLMSNQGVGHRRWCLQRYDNPVFHF